MTASSGVVMNIELNRFGKKPPLAPPYPPLLYPASVPFACVPAPLPNPLPNPNLLQDVVVDQRQWRKGKLQQNLRVRGRTMKNVVSTTY
jgi:hypothetical protein